MQRQPVAGSTRKRRFAAAFNCQMLLKNGGWFITLTVPDPGGISIQELSRRWHIFSRHGLKDLNLTKWIRVYERGSKNNRLHIHVLATGVDPSFLHRLRAGIDLAASRSGFGRTNVRWCDSGASSYVALYLYDDRKDFNARLIGYSKGTNLCSQQFSFVNYDFWNATNWFLQDTIGTTDHDEAARIFQDPRWLYKAAPVITARAPRCLALALLSA